MLRRASSMSAERPATRVNWASSISSAVATTATAARPVEIPKIPSKIPSGKRSTKFPPIWRTYSSAPLPNVACSMIVRRGTRLYSSPPGWDADSGAKV